MKFDDDEPIFAPPNVSALEAGETELTIVNKPEAPLKETKLKVLVELTVSGDNKHRCPVDLVTVLDVSGSMKDDDKIEKLRTAMQFLIRKLSPIDRLSVVTFSSDSTRLFPLRKITDESKDEIIKHKLDASEAGNEKNIAAGLRTGLQILEDRHFHCGRVGAIMLVSDAGQSDEFEDACQIHIDNFAVYTFGFGSDAGPEVLQMIAKNSKGGTFSDVRNVNDLSKAFSQCLAGLLTVAVRNLKLTITPVDQELKIQKVSAGSYPQTNNANGSITISFGEVYNHEVRLILVDLLLPKVDGERSSDVLQVTYTGSAGKGEEAFEAPPGAALVTRTKTATKREIAKMILEENRLKTVESVKNLSDMTDNRTLEEAKDKIVDAQNSLQDVEIDDGLDQSTHRTLISELQELFDLMETQERYENQGRAYAMSFETCHDRQRYAARGDMDTVRSFATPRMDAYLKQAKKFEEDPTKSPPSAEDDVERERDEMLDDPSIPYHVKLAKLFGKSVGYSIKNNIPRA